MKVILAPFEDPASGKDWDEQAPDIISDLKADLASLGVTGYEVKESNHGSGADWPTITLLLLAADLYFRVPELYSKIKDAATGWKQIAADTKKVIRWLHDKYWVIGLGTDTLFLIALDHACEKMGARDDEVVFLQMKENVPVEFRPSSDEVHRAVLFTFLAGNVLYQVVVDNSGAVAWDNCVTLKPNQALQPTR
jgi:hypothetical protein